MTVRNSLASITALVVLLQIGTVSAFGFAVVLAIV
jgi:hypothetical protein